MNDKKAAAWSLGIGSVTGTIVSTLILLVYAFITVKVQNVETSLSIPVNIAALCIGAFAGGFLCAKVRKQNGMMYGALCAVLVFLLLMILTVCCGAQPTVQTLLRLAAMIPVGAIGGILGVNGKKKRKRR